MKKLTLDLDTVCVQTFDPSPANRMMYGGTVQAHGEPNAVAGWAEASAQQACRPLTEWRSCDALTPCCV